MYKRVIVRYLGFLHKASFDRRFTPSARFTPRFRTNVFVFVFLTLCCSSSIFVVSPIIASRLNWTQRVTRCTPCPHPTDSCSPVPTSVPRGVRRAPRSCRSVRPTDSR